MNFEKLAINIFLYSVYLIATTLVSTPLILNALMLGTITLYGSCYEDALDVLQEMQVRS